MKSKISFFLVFIAILCFSQTENCSLKKNEELGIEVVSKKDVVCIAKNSEKKYTMLFTFGIWCAPCKLHLPDAMKLMEQYDVKVYVLLIDKENSKQTALATKYLREKYPNVKILVLKDDWYQGGARKRNKLFLTEITPPKFENIDDMSKYIIWDKNGEVLMVTNYKDMEGEDWRDDSGMIKRKVIPILEGNKL